MAFSTAAGRTDKPAGMGSRAGYGALAATVVLTSACDPVIDIEGAYFPAWLLSIVIGIVLTVPCRYLFVWTKLEPHLGPLALVYSSLALLLSLATWLLFFHT